MKAGKLRHLVSIRTPVTIPNAVGERVTDWNKVLASVHAEVRDMAGQELMKAQQVSADLTTKVRIRYLAGLTVKHRIYFGTRILEPVFITNVENRNVEQVLVCREVVD